jgi:hypothetical protein
MEGLNKNRLAILSALILMMLIAAFSGYRLQVGTGGLTFEPAIFSR